MFAAIFQNLFYAVVTSWCSLGSCRAWSGAQGRAHRTPDSEMVGLSFTAAINVSPKCWIQDTESEVLYLSNVKIRPPLPSNRDGNG